MSLWMAASLLKEKRAFLRQEALHDLLLGFLLGKAEGPQLQDLFAGDFADGGLMDQGGVLVAGVEAAELKYLSLIVAFIPGFAAS